MVDDIFGLGAPENLGGGSSAGVGDTGETTRVTRLFPAEPNPSGGATMIRFSLVDEGQVALRIYDARGMLVRTLEDGVRPAGMHRAVWRGLDADGNSVAPGVYFVHFGSGTVENTQKIMLLR